MNAGLNLNDIHQGVVLVADDEARNRDLLRDLLQLHGHRVVEACNGEDALEKVREVSPDVVLLDVRMPKMDGHEVCRQIKGNPDTAPIQVLMVTVLNDRNDRVKSIEAGADDFLSKPIDMEEVILRVRNAIYAKRLFDGARNNYTKLLELEKLRDSLTHMIVHDMRSPLTVILGRFSLLKSEKASLSEDALYNINQGLQQANVLIEMVNALLDVSKFETGLMVLDPQMYNLSELISESLKNLVTLAGDRLVTVQFPKEPVCVSCDAGLVRRVISNLVGNAMKFTPRDGEISVSLRCLKEKVRVAVSDNGQGIAPEFHSKIFEKFAQVQGLSKAQVHSTGLGLTFCKMAVEAHGGEIGVESDVGKGATFWFTLPA